jgi:hypothetical protein
LLVKGTCISRNASSLVRTTIISVFGNTIYNGVDDDVANVLIVLLNISQKKNPPKHSV